MSETPDDKEIDSQAFLTTKKGENRFKVRLGYVLLPNNTLRTAPIRKADYVVTLICEYPTYEEELEAKKKYTLFDENNSMYQIDTDKLSEWHIRRCLVQWDWGKVFGLKGYRLHRIQGLLADDSLALVLGLPPLVRKSISRQLWKHLGPA